MLDMCEGHGCPLCEQRGQRLLRPLSDIYGILDRNVDT
jgi:hypothetical protein